MSGEDRTVVPGRRRSLRNADITPAVERFVSSIVGRVATLERAEGEAPRRTLIQGDASLRNTRTSADGEIAFVDWEDVRAANGAVDLAWLLVSSVDPEQWEGVIEAYAPKGDDFVAALPGAGAQGVLSLSDCEEGSEEAFAWVRRLEAVQQFLQ